MILTCSNCSAKFNVADDAIGENGRNVKCSSCDHMWFERGSAVSEEVVQPIQSISPLPKIPVSVTPMTESDLGANSQKKVRIVVEPTPFYENAWVLFTLKFVSFIAFIALALIMLLTYKTQILNAAPQLKPLYEYLRLQELENLKFVLIDCNINKNGQLHENAKVVELDVKLVIKNTGDVEQKLEAVRFSTYTKDKSFLGEFTMQLNKTIAPNSEETIQGVLNRVPKDVTFAIIEMGNAFDLKIRRQSDVLNYKE